MLFYFYFWCGNASLLGVAVRYGTGRPQLSHSLALIGQCAALVGPLRPIVRIQMGPFAEHQGACQQL